MVKKCPAIAMTLLFLVVSPGLHAQEGQRSTPVEISTVTREAVESKVTLTGTVFPKTKSVIASEVEGSVERLFVEEGDFVEKGQIIAELGASLYRLQLREAVAARKETEQRFLQAAGDLKRSEDLVAKGFISEKELSDDRFDREALSKRLRQHEAEIGRLKDRLGKTRILAPFSGLVAKKHTEVGQWLDKGGAVATVIDLRTVHVTVSVPERLITKVRVGQQASVTADALDGETYHAEVGAIISEGDPETRVFPVKFLVVNRDLNLKSGMLARVTFAAGPTREGLLVPKDALVNRGEESVVFIVQNGKAKEVRVRIKTYHGKNAEIMGGVAVGDQVVIRGNERLRDGQEVQVLPPKGQT
jgi:RND family efflux transporter MFP subunit